MNQLLTEYLQKSQGQFAGFLDFIREDHPDIYRVVKDEFTFYEARFTLQAYLQALDLLWNKYVKGGDSGD